MKAMTWTKIKVAAAVVIAATVVCGGGTVAVKLAAGEPKATPKSAPAAAGKLIPNQWTKVSEDDLGSSGYAGFRGPALLYVPPLKRFLAALGVQNRFDRKPTPPYSELTFSLGERLWENWYPKGRNWGPKTGPATGAPSLGKYGSGLVKDKEGVLRPHLRGGRGISVWHQYCWDSHRNKAIFFGWGVRNRGEDPMQLLEYDPVARTWRQLAPKNSPLTPQLPGLSLKGYKPPWHWGSLCYDPVNKEVLLFGGASVITERGDPGTWAYSIAGNEWRKVARGSEAMRRLRKNAEALKRKAHAAVASCRNRYYRTELKENSAKKLSAVLDGVLNPAEIAALAGKVKAALARSKGYEKTQLERAGPELAAALSAYKKLLAGVDAGVGPAKFKLSEGVEARLRRAAITLSSQPPQRCYSPMVFDPKTKKIVLFGGTHLDRGLADTWVYDTATRSWEERRPKVGPSPRHCHGLLSLPKAGKVVLIGGWQTRFQIHTPLVPEAWTYDVAGNSWQLVKRWGQGLNAKGGPFEPLSFRGPHNNVVNFAVDENDVVLLQGRRATWACPLDVRSVDSAGTTKHGVAPGTERLLATNAEERSPGWYDSAPAPDARAVEAMLAKLPVNKWVQAIDGGRKRPTYAYTTIALDPHRDEILVWAGGHSTSHDSQVSRYSLATGRWHIDYPPQLAMGYNRVLWGMNYAYGYRPWMPRHPWMAYNYDPVARRLILLRSSGPLTLAFNPDVGDFERPEVALPPGGGAQANRMCTTPEGVVVWTTEGRLYRLDWAKKSWVRLPVKGAALPKAGFSDGLAYDTKREKLLLLRSRPQGQVLSYDLVTGELKDLKAKGQERAPGYFREFEYVPSKDIVFDMMGSAYLIEKNEWVLLKVDITELAKGHKKGKPKVASNPQGLVYDPKRDLLWAVNGYNNKGVFVLKLAPVK